MKQWLATSLVIGIIVAASTLSTQDKGEWINLLSLQEGAIPVVAPGNYSGWPVEAMIDESPETGWASEDGKVKGNIFVFELISPSTLEWFEFDTAGIDEDGAGAKDLTVETSAASPIAGFDKVLQASLAAKADRQKFPALKKISGRFIRLTIHGNHGSGSYTELLGFRGYGRKGSSPAPLTNISGTYDTDYSRFHVRQTGTALLGCYEFNNGLLNGAIEGRLMKITWREGDQGKGPAVMVFSPDGKSFRGYFWQVGMEKRAPSGSWDGKKIGDQVGGCPHWSGSLSGELKKQLQDDGRARVYGILFDLNSAVIRSESKPVLEEVVTMLRGEPSWKLTIEGHTDTSGGDAINQPLSQKRADSVKVYLVGAGIGVDRLQTKGFGASKPVTDNTTELGRAQNRRVELVRN